MRVMLLFTILALLSRPGAAQEKKIKRSCLDLFEIHKNGGKQILRYASNFRLNKTDTSIRTLLIFIHGLHREAMGYFEYAEEAARSAGQKKTTLVIAPSMPTRRTWMSTDWAMIIYTGRRPIGRTAIPPCQTTEDRRMSE